MEEHTIFLEIVKKYTGEKTNSRKNTSVINH